MREIDQETLKRVFGGYLVYNEILQFDLSAANIFADGIKILVNVLYHNLRWFARQDLFQDVSGKCGVKPSQHKHKV